jgi:hypothetical protein
MQLGPLGASSDAGALLENIAFVAVVSGASALAPAPTAPQPTIKTNRPALARRATSDLRMLVITFNCRRRTPDAHKRSTQARRRTPIGRWSGRASGALGNDDGADVAGRGDGVDGADDLVDRVYRRGVEMLR